MIPLRDSIRPRTFPFVNVFFIIVNFVVFFMQLSYTQEQLHRLYYIFGLVPVDTLRLAFGEFAFVSALVPFITSMFFHGGWLHIIGNMLYLWIFGDNVEDRLGHFRYFVFYLAVGFIAGVVHIISNPLSNVPVIGASGAVAGILGAYFLLFPRSKILSLVPIFFFITLVEIPAVVFIPIWFLIQVFQGVASLGGGAGSVAWWAHIGGFAGGAIIIKLLGIKPRRQIFK